MSAPTTEKSRRVVGPRAPLLALVVALSVAGRAGLAVAQLRGEASKRRELSASLLAFRADLQELHALGLETVADRVPRLYEIGRFLARSTVASRRWCPRSTRTVPSHARRKPEPPAPAGRRRQARPDPAGRAPRRRPAVDLGQLQLAGRRKHGGPRLLLRRHHRAARDQEQIAYLAYHDSLTGLANRAHVEEHLGPPLARARRDEATAALICIELDGFKIVNDTLGHGAGDEVLREIAERFASRSRAGDLLARQGGDEFLLLLPRLGADPAGVASTVAREMVAQLEAPLRIQGSEFEIGASVGISLFPRDGEYAPELLKRPTRRCSTRPRVPARAGSPSTVRSPTTRASG